ncbi:DUF4962 domain-containing protein [Corallococcus exercitus]|uniref:DUF4962 domain-containing protein n=1 Tax=Corallococcus exercitus TaxID=2316736 RepID=A0A7Y4KKG6_9BACT|nr:heparinase II/III family protein [Corallococcus exercitus]NOK34965.1 DUF4962 domain-containing protein [Corallococcus exercitus]
MATQEQPGNEVRPSRSSSLCKAMAILGGILVMGASAPSHAATTLSGNGISGVLAPGCTPGGGADFIDNADPNVVRLQPRDCGIVMTNTPSFSWVSPPERPSSNAFTFYLMSGSSTLATVTTPHPWLNMTSTRLAAGSYRWYVTYNTSTGITRTSRPRTFVVSSDASVKPFPSGRDFAATVSSRPFPRILPASSTFAGIASKAKSGEYSAEYSALIGNANTEKTRSGPTPDVVLPSPNLMHQTANERKAIEQLALAGLFTGDASYTSAAINRLVNFAKWSPTGPTSQSANDQANREIMLGLAEGLDMLHGDLTLDQINNILVSLRARILQVLDGSKGIDTWPNDSHGLTAIKYLTQSLTHVAGMPGFPEASGYLETAWELYLNTFNTFSTDDGAFGNGVAYGWYNMTTAAPSQAAVLIIGGVDLSTLPPVKNLGKFMMAMTPPNLKQMSAFGDETETDDLYFNYTWDSYRLYSALNNNAAYEWYWRVRPQNITLGAYPGIWQFMMLGLNRTLPAAVAPSNNSWLFEDAGQVAIHSDSKSSTRSSVFFHSSRFGSFNHSHAAQNAFEFVSNGENLLIGSGYYPAYGTPHHLTVTRATRYKNALTFDGGIGQAEPALSPTAPGQPYMSMGASGKLINYLDNGVWAVSTGDATQAYRGHDGSTGAWAPLLSNAIRTVAYNRSEGVLVIYDWATSATARTWELNFHSMAPFTNVIQNIAQTTSASGKASACFDVYGPAGDFVASSGFDVAPEKSYPTQYHARFSTRVKTTSLVAVTIIREGCRGIGRGATFTGSQATVTVNGGTPIVFDQRGVTVP